MFVSHTSWMSDLAASLPSTYKCSSQMGSVCGHHLLAIINNRTGPEKLLFPRLVRSHASLKLAGTDAAHLLPVMYLVFSQSLTVFSEAIIFGKLFFVHCCGMVVCSDGLVVDLQVGNSHLHSLLPGQQGGRCPAGFF